MARVGTATVFLLPRMFVRQVSDAHTADRAWWRLRSVLLLGMFMTPIFYPASAYPARFKLVLQLNPMAHLVGVVQELMLNHRFPHPHSIILTIIVSVIFLVIGYSVFHHHQNKFSDLV